MRLTLLDVAVMVVPLLGAIAFTAWLRRFVRTVPEFLAAGRGAGRYLLCTASGEASAGILGLVAAMEVFSRAGFSLHLWSAFTAMLWALMGVLGFVGYRFRQTRALTFHQFLEVRYSRGVRIGASFLQVFSGLFYFGLVPGVAARFFAGFLQLPAHFAIGGWVLPTTTVIMVGLLGLAVFFTLAAGQIGVLVTDSCEFVVSGVLYVVLAAIVLGVVAEPVVTWEQAGQALASGPPGHSFLDPFDVAGRGDFDGWFILCGMALNIYYFRGNAATAAAAHSAHEGRMAGIIGHWRGIGTGGVTALLMVVAFTRLEHPSFAHEARAVAEAVAGAGSEQLQTQLRMPVALGAALPVGARGALGAIALLGTLAGMGAYCMMLGSTLLQDVVLPLRGKPLEPRRQLRALRMSVLIVGACTVVFSSYARTSDYLQLLMTLFGSIYLGGMGAVVIGGLYWRRGTTAAAWVALCSGAILALTGWLLQLYWPEVQPWFAAVVGDGAFGTGLSDDPTRFPLNGQILSLITAAVCIVLYVAVSLAARSRPFPLDELLRNGNESTAPAPHRGFLARALGINEHFTRPDRWLAYGLFGYSAFWCVAAVVVLIWNLAAGRWSAEAWWRYISIQTIICALLIHGVMIAWLAVGATRDIRALLRHLAASKPEGAEDGQFFGPGAGGAKGAVAVASSESGNSRRSAR